MKIEKQQVFRSGTIELEVYDIRYVCKNVYHVALRILNEGFMNGWTTDCTLEEMQQALDNGQLVFLQGHSYRGE